MIVVIITIGIAVIALWTTTVFNRIQELEDETRDAWGASGIRIRSGRIRYDRADDTYGQISLGVP